jgi:hypothetical protein
MHIGLGLKCFWAYWFKGWNIFLKYDIMLELFLKLWPRIRIFFTTLAYGLKQFFNNLAWGWSHILVWPFSCSSVPVPWTLFRCGFHALGFVFLHSHDRPRRSYEIKLENIANGCRSPVVSFSRRYYWLLTIVPNYRNSLKYHLKYQFIILAITVGWWSEAATSENLRVTKPNATHRYCNLCPSWTRSVSVSL